MKERLKQQVCCGLWKGFLRDGAYIGAMNPWGALSARRLTTGDMANCQSALRPGGSWRGFGVALVVGLLSMLVSGCRTPPGSSTGGAAVAPELLQTSYLFEVVRYLYRWELDEEEIEQLEEEPQLIVRVCHLEPRLDPGDHSQEAEVFFPQLKIIVIVKKEDYNIEELKVVDKSPNFRITRVTLDQVPSRAVRGCGVVRVDMQELRDYLFRTRDEHDYPDQALLEHLRQALHKEASIPGILATNIVLGDQVVYFGPLSPVANDAWVFWEGGRKLFYVASDMDLSNPAVWEEEALTVHIFDLDEQVVGSHAEAPASNRFLTREQVSRALFNCVVLGQRIVVRF
jgi:hypothetical protein